MNHHEHHTSVPCEEALIDSTPKIVEWSQGYRSPAGANEIIVFSTEQLIRLGNLAQCALEALVSNSDESHINK